MIAFLTDEDVDSLNPETAIRDFISLLCLLAGRDRSYAVGKAETLAGRMESVIGGRVDDATRLSHEQLNEVLLLIEERRISEAFFDSLVRGERLTEAPCGPTVSLSDLKEATIRFRGFAMLSFGNFRFAFRTLCEIEDVDELIRRLHPWSEPDSILTDAFGSRPDSLAAIREGENQIAGDDTWLLGYLSVSAVLNDLAFSELLAGRAGGKSHGEIIRGIRKRGEESLANLAAKYRPNKATVDKWRDSITKVVEESRERHERLVRTTELGVRNTERYLTWDYMDVYVATSMRHRWEFRETWEFARAVFAEEVLRPLNLRWFDPTQSYEASVRDKGLLEALMLRRARCTVYMVQESDTLGKDSELAATLAQGKPVIAYVRQVEEGGMQPFAEELASRPLAYHARRLHSLFADGFFRDLESLTLVSDHLATFEERKDATEISAQASELLKQIEEAEVGRIFQLHQEEEEELRRKMVEAVPSYPAVMSAVEAVVMEKRAITLKRSHPLAIQVHLESGVANGVLVVRSPTECARLLDELLTNKLRFRIAGAYNANRERLGTELVEERTSSVFRYVTDNALLTNSFWNFYLLENT